MPELEERVSALEHRVDVLTGDVGRATDLSVTAGREALTAREAHQHNVELLNALRQTQAEHSATLAEHSATLAEHSATLAEHGRILAHHTTRFDHQDEALAQLAVGMYSIERLLTRLVADED